MTYASPLGLDVTRNANAPQAIPFMELNIFFIGVLTAV